MRSPVSAVGALLALTVVLTTAADAQECVDCHTKISPGIVEDWRISAHAREDVGCQMCHGDGHSTADDVGEVLTITAQTCAVCHQERFDQFARGKHALS